MVPASIGIICDTHLPLLPLGEEGLDLGGLRREWMSSTIETLLNPVNGLFVECERERRLRINPLARFLVGDHLQLFKCLGILLGKAFLDYYPIRARLILPLIKRLFLPPTITASASIENNLNDISYIDQQLHDNLIWIRDNHINNPQELSLTFK